MFIKTFLVGLMIFFKAARAYVNRNRDGLEEHTTGEEMAFILNAVDAITDVINLFLPNTFLTLEGKGKQKQQNYKTALSKLREIKANEPKYRRIPASVERID